MYALVMLLLLGTAQAAAAQVGIRSGVARVTLTARSLAQGWIGAVEPLRVTSRNGTLVEASTLVRWTANTGYRLSVRSGSPSTRIWVQDVNGEYQELTGSAGVTLARDRTGTGWSEREVHYRLELPEKGELTGALPVYYEIAINPAI